MSAKWINVYWHGRGGTKTCEESTLSLRREGRRAALRRVIKRYPSMPTREGQYEILMEGFKGL